MKAAAVLVVLALTGCTSLPLPASHDESLLVIPLRWETPAGNRVANAVQLTLRSEASNRTYTESASPGSPLLSFALPPGQYRVQNALLLYRNLDNNEPGQDPVRGMGGRAILIGELQVLLWDGAIEVLYNGDWFRAENAPTGADGRRDVSARLRSDPRWAAWETHQRVGFASGG